MGDAPNLTYNEYILKNDLDVGDNVIFSQYDKRIKLWITKGENKMERNQEEDGVQEVM